ncbi:Hypothetical predicted protein [Pelobates cultripes]|uniref:Uncharacterized protein n=1 Tax=Pelobates cultripes TaxID=61616 RepID=A0AAD1WQ57_PELCU|nr:Hypothetical predicted protein [Pelobates cultripes]
MPKKVLYSQLILDLSYPTRHPSYLPYLQSGKAAGDSRHLSCYIRGKSGLVGTRLGKRPIPCLEKSGLKISMNLGPEAAPPPDRWGRSQSPPPEDSATPAVKPPATGAPSGGNAKMADATWLPAPTTTLEDILIRLDNRFLEFWWRLESVMGMPTAIQLNAPLHQSAPRKPAAPHRGKHPTQRLFQWQTQPNRQQTPTSNCPPCHPLPDPLQQPAALVKPKIAGRRRRIKQASHLRRTGKLRIPPASGPVMPRAPSILWVSLLQLNVLPQRLLPRPQTHRTETRPHVIHGRSPQGPNEALDEPPKHFAHLAP